MTHATESQLAHDWVVYMANFEPDYDEVEEPDRIERD